eukprot:TRINITY_DN8008_c0_g1_i1.p1 TRINITY_DN8008_c0_g1~~TRINITY_DN8008_c0_g1_i1.p1  ORF type:complete len:260 (+),score=71.09 TRINITY_DN8008_c0_g1_i1:75-854(+)
MLMQPAHQFQLGHSSQQKHDDMPIHLAVLNNDKSTIKKLIWIDREVVKQKGKYDWTPLHVAVREKNVKLAKLFIKKGTPVDEPDTIYWTSLHRACRDGHLDLVKLLVASGADVNKKTMDGWAPLHFAAYNAREEVLDWLLSLEPNSVQVDVRTVDLMTPLHLAAMQCHNTIIQKLLAKGADRHAKDKNDRTPYSISMEPARRGRLQNIFAKHETLVDKICKYIAKSGENVDEFRDVLPYELVWLLRDYSAVHNPKSHCR